jgi:uncharacterized membrane protein
MSGPIVFEFPAGWQAGLPVAALVLGCMAWWQWRRGMPPGRILSFAVLRAVVLGILVILIARPVRLAHEPLAGSARPVTVLVDCSESMSLDEPEGSRYGQAVNFLERRLGPALEKAGIALHKLVFDAAAREVDAGGLARLAPAGKRTNLGGAIAQSIHESPQPPLAIVALTDGIANEGGDNVRAISALAGIGAPFIGVGFGNEKGIKTLTLREVRAPATVAPKSVFNVSARLEMPHADDVPGFDLLLFRDGQMARQKRVSPGKGPRTWVENFQVTEEAEGAHRYGVQLLPPSLPELRCANTAESVSVRVAPERELRVLYIQGALTWDYKFINRALKRDQSIKMTGLTRTSQQSVFRQNVESAGELLNGFPTTLEQLAPFRVVVLSNVRPADLSADQQEILARFCGEMGGGLLMIGGGDTFDESWRNSRLERLLPVVIAGNPGARGVDREFRMQLTPQALRNPVFQISDGIPAREAWAKVPGFTQYGRVDAAKPGAEVWALHSSDEGPHGKRILMAAQRYGAGLSAVLCVQNVWRWRLAKDADEAQYDRFWRQMFRFLGEVARPEVAIHLADQELVPGAEVKLSIERQPNPRSVVESGSGLVVRVHDDQKNLLLEQSLDLAPLQTGDIAFLARNAGAYQVTVLDSAQAPLTTRSIDVREVNMELRETGRNMEHLRQWASVSDGLAVKVEDCPNAGELVARIRERIERVKRDARTRQPVGINALTLSLLLGCLGMDWILRKKWGLR